MTWDERLSDTWHGHGLNSPGGADDAAIAAFEARYSLTLPPEVRLYFQKINGMSKLGGHDVDANQFQFLQLVDVRSVEEFSAAMNWKIRHGMGTDTAFVFVDYLQWSWAYAFETAAPHAGSIYLIDDVEPKIVARSLVEFIELYLADDQSLYHPR